MLHCCSLFPSLSSLFHHSLRNSRPSGFWSSCSMTRNRDRAREKREKWKCESFILSPYENRSSPYSQNAENRDEKKGKNEKDIYKHLVTGKGIEIHLCQLSGCLSCVLNVCLLSCCPCQIENTERRKDRQIRSGERRWHRSGQENVIFNDEKERLRERLKSTYFPFSDENESRKELFSKKDT